MTWSPLHLTRFSSNPLYFHNLCLHGSDYITGSLLKKTRRISWSGRKRFLQSEIRTHNTALPQYAVSALHRLPNGAAASFFLKEVKIDDLQPISIYEFSRNLLAVSQQLHQT